MKSGELGENLGTQHKIRKIVPLYIFKTCTTHAPHFYFGVGSDWVGCAADVALGHASARPLGLQDEHAKPSWTNTCATVHRLDHAGFDPVSARAPARASWREEAGARAFSSLSCIPGPAGQSPASPGP